MRICSAMVAALLLTGPAQAQEPAHWRLVEEWRVGGAVDGALSLNNVRAVLPMADGRIVILEGKDQQVHILSNRGVPIRTIGRRGAGPGEFQNATGLLVMPDGRIMVHDVSNARLTILAANGDLVRTVTHVPWCEDTQWDARFGTDGHLDESGSIARMDPAMGIATSSQGIRRLWNADFTQADTTRAPACANLPEATYQDIVWQGPSPLMRGMFQSVPYQFVLMPRHAHASARDGTLWIGLYPEYQTIKRITFGTASGLHC